MPLVPPSTRVTSSAQNCQPHATPSSSGLLTLRLDGLDLFGVNDRLRVWAGAAASGDPVIDVRGALTLGNVAEAQRVVER